MNEQEHLTKEETALFIHGIGAAVAFIGVFYNWRNRKWLPLAGNLLCLAFHMVCVWYHFKDVKDFKKPNPHYRTI